MSCARTRWSARRISEKTERARLVRGTGGGTPDRTGGTAAPGDEKTPASDLTRLRVDDRRPLVGVILTIAILTLAVLKPWGGGVDASRPVPSDRSSAAPADFAAATPGLPPPSSTTQPGYDAPGGQCYPSSEWRLFALEMNTGRRLRTWLSIEPGSASNPEDRAVPFVHLVTDRLLALGFCVGSRSAGAPATLDARAWTLASAGAALPVPLAPLAAYMPRQAELGAVYLPPRSTSRAAAGWSPGRYVFAVRLGPGDTDLHWFGVDVIVAPSAAPPAP